MILFSYNANGDLKHVGELIDLVIKVGAGGILCLIAGAAWLFYRSHVAKRAEQREAQRQIRQTDALADEHRRDG